MNNESKHAIVSNRDGEFCKICGTTADKKQLHLTSKTSKNATLDDLFLLCTECLARKQLYELCESESKKTKNSEQFVTELQVNRRKEARFRQYVFQRISELNKMQVEERDLINSAAEEIGISPTTARRYLDKMCSSAGVLTHYDDGEHTFVEFALKAGDFIE